MESHKLPAFLIEACVENVDQAIHAYNNGADRIELCAHLDLDGLTPSFSLVETVLSKISIPVRVMIRQRAGSFYYSSREIMEMHNQIEQFKSLPIDGFVFGLLTQTGEIDIPNTSKLIACARPLAVTFHKAIDLTPDLEKSIELLSRMNGLTSVLTSGGNKTAEEGAKSIRKMVDVAEGKLEIIGCGKITSVNLKSLHQIIQAPAYHGRRIV